MPTELQILDWFAKNWQTIPLPVLLAAVIVAVLYARATLSKVVKSHQRRIEQLERQMGQLQAFHARNHPIEGAEILEGNRKSLSDSDA